MPDVEITLTQDKFNDVLSKVLAKVTIKPIHFQTPGSDESGIPIMSESTPDVTITQRLHLTMPWFGLDAKIHILGSDEVEFKDDNTFSVTNLKISWDSLFLHIGLDIPTISFGGFCAFRIPKEVPVIGGKCALPVPEVQLFTATPDISIPFDLTPIPIISEISGLFRLVIKPDKDDENNPAWGIYVHPFAVNVNVIDLHDTLNQLPGLLDAAIAAVLLQLTAVFPADFLLDVFLNFLGVPTLEGLVLDLLGINNDVKNWLMNALKVSIGIDNLIMQAIFAAVLDSTALYQVPNPYPVIDAKTVSSDSFGGYGGLAPTKPFRMPSIGLPTEQPDAVFQDQLFVLTFDFAF